MKRTSLKSLSVILLLVFIVSSLSVGSAIWNDYRDKIMENQKQQLLITSRILADGMEASLKEYYNSLVFLSNISGRADQDAIYGNFLTAKKHFETDIFWENDEGTLIKSFHGMRFMNPILITRMSDGGSIFQYEDEQGKRYLVMKKQLEDGAYLCMAIDEERYYQQLISQIHIGTNGYIMVKNSQGLILMHPEREQWGIQVIEGRKKLYPDLDYASLEKMVEQQCAGGEGILEYYSYWWGSEPLSRVKKITAYAPVELENDFWIISAVVDYDDFYAPIESGFREVSLLFVGTLSVLAFLALFVGKLLFDRQKNMKEIVSLRELNEKLEELHQGEEMLAHQQRLQVMGTMTGGIAHEFNNFLTPIMGYAELLMMELPEGSDEYDSAKEIYEASEKAKDVIRQIASLSRRNVETVYKNIEAARFVQRVIKMIESICPANVRLDYEIALGDEYILGNTTQINQVILNICVNAVHAIGKQEGYIFIAAECVERAALLKIPHLENTKLPEYWNRYVHITIEDNGCGMETDTLRQIFIPFYTTKKSGEGTGLGLALAEQIVTSHRGCIYAESEAGKGSRFHIFLPVMEAGERREEMGREESETLKMVIADDNVKILQMLVKNFSRLKNIQIYTCSEKNELYGLLETASPDVMVLDMGLSNGSSVEFCMSIQGKYPNMLKIIMVDYFTRDIVEAKQMKIIDGYLTKPVSDIAILETIRNCRD